MTTFLSKYRLHLILTAASLILYWLYIYDLTGNPPGFYIDESLLSYNAYLLANTGHGEFGPILPLYFPVIQLPPPHYFLGYADPVQIYLLAGLFLIFSPSILLPRLMCATAMFIACLLLGRLATNISGRRLVGVIVTMAAILTPWLFEVGRLAFAVGLYPLTVVLLLQAIHTARKKAQWTLLNCAAMAISLALVTYTYSIGRLLGPLMALGLVIFATSLRGLIDVLKVWMAFGITLIPMLVFHLRNPGALAGRFNETVGIVKPTTAYGDLVSQFVTNFAENISIKKMLLVGDTNLRHHINDTGAVLAAVLLLAVFGLILIIVRHRRDPWWWYIIFGLVASVVPASLTQDQFHMLRLIGFPVFMIVLTIPALTWFLETKDKSPQNDDVDLHEHGSGETAGILAELGDRIAVLVTPRVRLIVCAAILILGVSQAVLFQMSFWKIGPKRGLWFDDGYSRVLDVAIANPLRPIYLVDGYWGQAYLHGYWYGVVKGIDLSNFVHLREGERPPDGALVLSSEQTCLSCEMIFKDGTYILYVEKKPPIVVQSMP